MTWKFTKIWVRIHFYWIINPRKFNIIVGVIYKHPKMDVTDSNNNWNNLLKNINQEQKQVLLLGVFNVDLMYFNEREPSNEFLDSLTSNSYLSYIIQPSRHKVTIFSVMSSIVCIGVSHPPLPHHHHHHLKNTTSLFLAKPPL